MTRPSLFNEKTPQEGDGGGAGGASEGAGGGVGGRITEVSSPPSNPNLRRIKVDGRIVARLGASDVEALKIEVGRKWTSALAARVEEAKETAKARRAAMTMLGRRAFSRGEMIDRLMRRGYSKSIAHGIADDLHEHHWLDDDAYATALAEELVNRKGASHALIVDRLVARKIDEQLARDVANRILGKVDPIEAATDLARKRLATMKGVEPNRSARRIAAFLARRGFDEETINESLQQAGIIND